MDKSGYSDELFEVLGNELRAVVKDDTRCSSGYSSKAFE